MKRVYWILSGEGVTGTWTRHHVTPVGIQRIATRKRCGGDRWASIWEEIPETETTLPHLYNIETGDLRDIPEL
jgi:hypothetical protein